MSRDGLFPPLFKRVHPRYKTPHVSTWIAGLVVGLPAGVFATSDAADLSNIGTLFAFVLVSAGVVALRRTQPHRPRLFRVPLSPLVPLTSILLCTALMSGLTLITWIRFGGWMALGLAIYALYSRHRSEFGPRGQRWRRRDRVGDR
jgi:basic amino acid/polyamine antiporter, APA family